MDFREFKDAVVAAAKAAGLVDYELYYEQSESISAGSVQRQINQFTNANSGGVCFRAVINGKIGAASTEELSAEQAESIVARAIENGETIESEEKVFLCDGGRTYEPYAPSGLAIPATSELVDAAIDANDRLLKVDSRVEESSAATAMAEKAHISIFNSKGLDLSWDNTAVGMMAMAITSDGKEKTNSYEMRFGELSGDIADEITDEAVRSAISKLGSQVAPTAVCPVIFSPDAMASLLSTFASIFSSENAQKGLSLLAGKEGAVVASDAVTLVDDPFCDKNPFRINFDGEGCPAHRKNVIEKGRLTTLLYNLKTAAVAGRETTGNASRANYSAPVGIAPFSMYLEAGTLTEDELFAKAGNGVYINSLGGTHAGANPVSGDFSLQSAGAMIENGKKTTPVKSFTVAGNFYELLGKITDLSNEVIFPAPRGTTTFGSPFVLVDNLSIAGK